MPDTLRDGVSPFSTHSLGPSGSPAWWLQAGGASCRRIARRGGHRRPGRPCGWEGQRPFGCRPPSAGRPGSLRPCARQGAGVRAGVGQVGGRGLVQPAQGQSLPGQGRREGLGLGGVVFTGGLQEGTGRRVRVRGRGFGSGAEAGGGVYTESGSDAGRVVRVQAVVAGHGIAGRKSGLGHVLLGRCGGVAHRGVVSSQVRPHGNGQRVPRAY